VILLLYSAIDNGRLPTTKQPGTNEGDTAVFTRIPSKLKSQPDPGSIAAHLY
jgi:hypothetical protein